MIKYVPLIEVFKIQQLNQIKFALDKENIIFTTFFEQTLQTADAYALGGSGARIDVEEDHLERAKEVLKSLDITVDYDPKKDEFGFIEKLDVLTSNIPIIGKWLVIKRLLFIAMLFFGALFFIVYLGSK